MALEIIITLTTGNTNSSLMKSHTHMDKQNLCVID